MRLATQLCLYVILSVFVVPRVGAENTTEATTTEFTCPDHKNCDHGCWKDDECHCHAGFIGTACDIDFCTDYCELKEERVCSLDKTRCLCKDDYVEVGGECHKPKCTSHAHCKHNGTCISGTCLCEESYEGKTCEKQRKCSSDKDCHKRGTCDAQFTCECKPGYYGRRCLSTCQKNEHCGDHGKCTYGICKCDDEWMGEKCEIKMCKNNTDCIYGICHFDDTCLCHLGYTGQQCQINEHDEGDDSDDDSDESTESSQNQGMTSKLPSTKIMVYILVGVVVLIGGYFLYYNRSKLMSSVKEQGPKWRRDGYEKPKAVKSKDSGKTYIY